MKRVLFSSAAILLCLGSACSQSDEVAGEEMAANDGPDAIGDAPGEGPSGEMLLSSVDDTSQAVTTTTEGGREQRISFAQGSNSATVQGSVSGYEFVDYLLNVRAGQTMNVSMATDNTANYFNILEPGETEAAVFVGSTSGNQFEGAAKESGDYRIRVYLMRSAARRNETGRYRLETVVTGSSAAASKAAAPADPIRGPGGLEEKCKARVASETGSRVIGTNRIEDSEAATAIYVNVQGAQAPWRCLGYRDGTIGEVMYTGDEGAL